MLKFFKRIIEWIKSLFTKKEKITIESEIFLEAPKYFPLPNGEFPVKATYAFYDPFIDGRHFKELKECGFNVIGQNLSQDALDRNLEFAKKYDLYVGACPYGKTNENTLKTLLEKYKNNPNIWTFSMVDEPNISQFEEISHYQNIFNEYAPNVNPIFNLFPACGKTQLGTDSYQEYVRDFIKIVNPAFISYDCYPIKADSRGEWYIDDCQWRTLEVISAYAKMSNRPFWTYLLSNKHWSYPKPSTGSIRFQMYSALAYGTQALMFWTYGHPDFDKDNEFSEAIIDKEGNLTDTYYITKDLLSDFRKIQHIFLNMEVINVGHIRSIPEYSKEFNILPDNIKSIKLGGYCGAVVSHFKNKDKEYLLVVSKDIYETNDLEIITSNYNYLKLWNGIDFGNVFETKFKLKPLDYLLFEI
ncbi:MAG: hypothetical protein J1F35_08690 [Erysipelotrichales bacterium]|nr:hypothetical protein [Erysipelotrichales bacterium]